MKLSLIKGPINRTATILGFLSSLLGHIKFLRESGRSGKSWIRAQGLSILKGMIFPVLPGSGLAYRTLIVPPCRQMR